MTLTDIVLERAHGETLLKISTVEPDIIRYFLSPDMPRSVPLVPRAGWPGIFLRENRVTGEVHYGSLVSMDCAVVVHFENRYAKAPRSAEVISAYKGKLSKQVKSILSAVKEITTDPSAKSKIGEYII
jgi:hypothetical protein